ncbi:MAG: hypothetical protein A4E64_01670 [Syntrophorhabdus sp. PtaU1.Bin058]|nr:MAG: hypothetical protein A4E64_01670 [Syntrophorhabdus sp. PtaU1.Bin058]
MTKKKATIIQGTASKAVKLQNYRASLKQRHVSGTTRESYPSFDDTASAATIQQSDFNVPAMSGGQQSTKKSWSDLKKIGTIGGIILGILGLIGTACYKFGALETSIEFIQNGLKSIQNRVDKIDEEHRKDYQKLNDKLNDQTIKNKK